MKWSRLANMPSPLSEPYAVINQSKIFVTGCVTSHGHNDAIYQVYCYNCCTNQWCVLPRLQHHFGVPHIVGGKLVIFGGRLSHNSHRTSKVSTFDQSTQSWISFYPDMTSVRSRPGVVTHLEYVIVAGGTVDDGKCVNDIEILNWVENYAWRIVTLRLPFPMFALTPTICNDNLCIVGYSNQDGSFRNVYMIPAGSIASPLNTGNFKSWNKLKRSSYHATALVPGLPSPVTVGGHCVVDKTHSVSITDICIYDEDADSWKQVDKLSSPRSDPAVVTVSNNAIVVIGGSVRQRDMTGTKCLSTVELGQAKLVNDTAV